VPGGSFAAWLGGLGEEELAGVLAARPDARAMPQPVSLGELAQRLLLPHGVVGALGRLSLPQVQLMEVVAALGDGAARSRVQGLLDDAREEEFERVLAGLSRQTLVWPQGERLRLVEPLREWPLGEGPLGLGPSAAVLVPRLTADVVRRVGGNLGVPVKGRRKSDLVEAVVAALRDGDRVRRVVAAAPARVRGWVETVASTGVVPVRHRIMFGAPGGDNARRDDPFAWAVGRGLVIQLDWQEPVMTAEVALALRGPAYRAPFSPADPVPDTVPVPGDVAMEFAAVAARAVQETTALVRMCAERPPVRRKSGGIGVRELRRVAKAAGCGEDAARLWLELAACADLVDFDGIELVPTGAFDDWRRTEPGDRLVSLLRTWLRMPRLPLLDNPDDDGRAVPLDRRAHDPAAPRLRAAVVQALAALPVGHGVSGPDALTEAVLWRRPLMFGDAELAPPYIAAIWREAELLGVVVRGGLSAAGRTLAATARQGEDNLAGDMPAGDTWAGDASDDGERAGVGEGPSLEEVVAGALAVECETAVLQADLTAVVTGPPSAGLVDMLDRLADGESRGAASIWRFSPGSVRRALDLGHTAAELLADLRDAAATGIPQPLEYLINDVARRHGEVVVTPLASAICSTTPGLLAEIRANRQLRDLGLRELAPTVLASTRPVPETLDALRSAGYLPIGQGPGGVPLVERRSVRRSQPRLITRRPDARRSASEATTRQSPRLGPAELARRLRGTAVTVPTRSTPDGSTPTAEHLAEIAPQLNAAERRLLAHALDTGDPVRIDYVSSDGKASDRVIEGAALDIPPLITAWCRLRDDERNFHAGRITAVAPG
jgi:hypothetical protein